MQQCINEKEGRSRSAPTPSEDPQRKYIGSGEDVPATEEELKFLTFMEEQDALYCC